MITERLQASAQTRWESPYHIPSNRRSTLLISFWIIAFGVIGFIFTHEAPFESILGATIIAIAALLPSLLWCSGIAKGFPIFPLLSLTFLWTNALPLVTEHRKVLEYTPAEHLEAAITTVIFLAIGTLAWLPYVKSYPYPPKFYRSFRLEQGNSLFFWLLGFSILYQVAFNTGWIWLLGGGNTIPILRGFVLGLNTLGVFVLSYYLGKRELSKNKARLFLSLLVIYLIVNAASLYLIGVFTTVLLATIGFTVGRRQLPWKPLIIVLLIGSLLHLGKPEMRSKYWFGNQVNSVYPWEYPAYFTEWIGYSLEQANLTGGFEGFSIQKNEETAPLTQRSSLIHLLLLVQHNSPEYTPYLKGETYKIIPNLLVPRFLNPNKLRGGQGNHILSIHYGLQTYRATLTTSIGWGLLQEAYANFGISGCIGLAVILGNFYGQVTRWSMQTSILSFRSLFAIIVTNSAFQTEWTAGIFVSATFQATIPLIAVSFLLMKQNMHPFYLSDSIPINSINSQVTK